MTILLGAIADDFTGATDLASTLVNQGMRTCQVIGVPDDDVDTADAQAVVVALKSRTSPVEQAVSASLAAARWLRRRGARQLVFKVCSTFDSTARGNIGPVADALADEVGATLQVVCPAFPANGRTVYQGHLFVGSQLLSESSMKDHPLTPMRDASLPRLLGAQTRRGIGLVPHQRVAAGSDEVAAQLAALAADGLAYAVVDAVCDDDLDTIGAALADQPLVTGGSGIARGLPRNFRDRGLLGPAATPMLPRVAGRAVVLAGSCSRATRGQVEAAGRHWPRRELDVEGILAGDAVVDQAMDWVAGQDADTPVLLYTSADPARIGEIQARHGREQAGEQVEAAFGQLACALRGTGARRMIVAGGETSGAVVSALGIRALTIGAEIDPGVPWTTTPGGDMALALKSGNFGGEDFFARALAMLP